MKSSRLSLIAALSPILVLAAAAQTPPPPPADASAPPAPISQVQGASPATRSSRVNAVIYGPQGEVQALTLRNGVAVTLTPDLATRLQSSVTKGTRVQVSGVERVIAGQTSLIAQSLTANGQTFVAAPAPSQARPEIAVPGTPPPPPAGPLGPAGPCGRRRPGAPPPPPPNAAAPPPQPAGAGAPPPPTPPDGAAPPPPPAGVNPPAPPQM